MRLEAVDVCFRYTEKTPFILKNASFSINEGERVGIVSPSGYGKTTFAKLLAGYERPGSGRVLIDGKPLPAKGALPVQMVCQHPEYAVNPRWKMRRVLEEAGQTDEKTLAAMGINPDWLNRYPRELSGGELQRFCAARSLCAKSTRFLIADELSAMLDAVTQAQIWKSLLNEAEKRNVGLIVITHNASLAARVCGRVADLRDINGIENAT